MACHLLPESMMSYREINWIKYNLFIEENAFEDNRSSCTVIFFSFKPLTEELIAYYFKLYFIIQQKIKRPSAHFTKHINLSLTYHNRLI